MLLALIKPTVLIEDALITSNSIPALELFIVTPELLLSLIATFVFAEAVITAALVISFRGAVSNFACG